MHQLHTVYQNTSLVQSEVERPADRHAVDEVTHAQRVKRDLKNLGASRYGVWRFGSRYLPKLIHDDETIGGLVYGYNDQGSIMLLATNLRILYLDKKPLFLHVEELTYDIIGGVSYSKAGLGSTLILHTKMGNYKIKLFNDTCAQNFMRYVESRYLENTGY